jgi:catechol 2,3-dioxygenase-like lactoylglutathione lyase family enzyme
MMRRDGLRGINHIGVPVRNLADTVAWYREMFEIEPTFYLRGVTGPEVAETVQVEGAVIDCAFFVVGNVCLEFLEYTEPEGRDFDLRNCDVGAVHVCFEVDDVNAMYEQLLAKGVVFSSPPRVAVGGPLDGIRLAYFRDHQGLQLEFFQVPEGSLVRATY